MLVRHYRRGSQRFVQDSIQLFRDSYGKQLSFTTEYQVGEKIIVYYCNAPGNSLEEALEVTTIEVNKYVTRQDGTVLLIENIQ